MCKIGWPAINHLGGLKKALFWTSLNKYSMAHFLEVTKMGVNGYNNATFKLTVLKALGNTTMNKIKIK